MTNNNLKEEVQRILAEHGETLFLKGRGDNQPMVCGKGCPKKILDLLAQQRLSIVEEQDWWGDWEICLDLEV